jgi:CHAT domain-containing protein/Tfp pilus assembly protein PilF
VGFPKWVGVFFLVLASAGPEGFQDQHEEIRRLLTAANYAAAESQARALVATLETSRPESLDLARALDLLVQALVEGGKPADPAALPSATRAVALTEKVAGPDDPAVANSLSNLGLVLRRQGKLDEARAAYERALRIREKTVGPDHPDVARVLAALSALASNAGDFPRGRELGERAVQIAEKAGDSVNEAVAANNLALALFQLNDYAESKRRLEQALHAYERALGPDHPEVGKTLSNLANVVSESGDLAEARRLYERAIAIQEKRQGPNHPDVALNVNNLGDVFYLLGDFDTSAAQFERALKVLEQTFGPQHTRVAMALGNLAQVRAAQGQRAEARALYSRALAIRENALGPEHPSLVYTLTGFAELHARLAERDVARTMFNRALAIAEKAFGPDHPVTALALQGRGDLELDERKFAEAEASISRALRIRTDLLGAEHPLVAESRASLALVFARTGRTAEAFNAAIESERVSRAHLEITAQALAERQALSYAAHRVSGADVALSILAARAQGDANSVRRTWDAMVRSRALVLEEMTWRRRLVATTNNATVSGLATELAAARQRVAGLLVRHAGDPASRHRIEEALAARDAAERALAEQSVEFRTEQAHARAGIDEVTTSLPPQAALVAFVRFRRSTLTGAQPPHDEYLAFVARGEGQAPLAISLGPARIVDERIREWRAAIAAEIESGRPTRRAERLHADIGAAIRRLVWDPLRDALAGRTQVFIVPAGPLHLVNWAALPDRTGTYLVEGPQLIHYLSSERDLNRPAMQSGEGLLLVDNPTFDTRTAVPGASPTRGAAAAPGACTGLASLQFDPLPSTRREGDAITTLWRSLAEDGGAERLTGSAATEAQVRARAPGNRVVHFATHGFFLGAWCRPAAATTAARHPLVLAGLALAGANRREARAPADDGVLLAEEVVSLDLRGTEWAVLSACDTGAGVVAAGEELFGLRRAFQIAGARTVIVSLWPVDDETTRLWMDAVYRARFLEHASTAKAIRAATVKTIAARRAHAQSTHPAYWGAFVAAGGT